MENLASVYDPRATEKRIYDFWEQYDCFKADASSDADSFSIVIPPPNVTGILHIGHALDNTLQDILIRYNRMMGKATLWLPGTDHAGIATQNVVEKNLRAEGISRYDLGREKFLENVWEWANDRRTDILDQFKQLGVSFDLSRQRFTLDEGCSRAVKEVFVRLYEKGLIYKGSYIVNWCPRCSSAISDIETTYKEEDGHLWEISYSLENEVGAIVIATTRPETLYGDVAVAVHPDDMRFKHLIGKRVVLPLTRRTIPVIADEAVEKDFGTGALKITPAHDPNDYEIGKKHGLEPIWIMDKNGHMVNDDRVHPDVKGLDRYEAREKTIGLLKYHGLLIRTKKHQHNIGHCQRCDTVVEPFLSEQWFVRMKPLAEKPIQAVENGELNFIPERWTKLYLDWMTNIRDWCISRQIWWGHQIPAYYCLECGEMMVAIDRPQKCTKCNNTSIEQETDVLDTWFSSALWPFSTMGWPNTESSDFQKFYPTSVLVTSFDIIFFWVARMVVMGYEFTGQSPFKYVYIHGLIRDEQGRKMSKSTGNVIDPREVIENYGSDALRFTLTTLNTYGGQDIKLSDERVEYGRNFANKIWNASRFVLMNLEGIDNNPVDFDNLTIADCWIISQYHQMLQRVHSSMDTFHLGEYASIMYEFIWNVYCDWYIEIAKTQLANEKTKLNTQRVLRYVLDGMLKALHPIMPHLTEEIWQKIPQEKDTIAIMLSSFPKPDESKIDKTVDTQMELVAALISTLRNIRQSLNIPFGTKIDVIIESYDALEKTAFQAARNYIEILAKAKSVEIKSDFSEEAPPQSASGVVGVSKIIVPLAGLIDVDKEIQRQKNKLEKLNKEKKSLEGRLRNEQFMSQAPDDVKEKTQNRVNELIAQINNINDLIGSLAG
jgi:valyl-tRNA synthetase